MGNAAKCCVDRDTETKVQWQQRVSELEVENRRLRGKIQKLRGTPSPQRKVQFEGAGDVSPRSPFSAMSPLDLWGAKKPTDNENEDLVDLLLEEFWPAVRQYIEERVLRGSVEVELKRRVWEQLRYLRVSMGKEAPYTSGTRLRRLERPGRDHVLELSLDIVFTGEDVELWMEVDAERQAQVDKIMLQGTLTIELQTTHNHVPGLWAATVCFYNRPDVCTAFIGPFGALADKILLAREVIEDNIASALVVPQRILLPLSSSALPYSFPQAPDPEGLLIVHLKSVTQSSAVTQPEEEQLAGEDEPAKRCAITVSFALGADTWTPPSADLLQSGKDEQAGQVASFDVSHALVVDALHAQVLLASVYSKASDSEEQEYLGSAKIGMESLCASSHSGSYTLEVSTTSPENKSLGRLAKLHVHGEIRKFMPPAELPPQQSTAMEPGVLILALESIRDLGVRCDDQEVEVQVQLSGGSAQSSKGTASRLSCQSAGQKQEQLQYYLFGAGKDTLSHEAIAWTLGMEESWVRAIARNTVEARFGHVFRFVIDKPADEVLTLEVKRRRGKGTVLGRYRLQLSDLLKEKGCRMPMQERPLEAGTGKMLSRSSSRVPHFMAEFRCLMGGEVMRKEELHELLDIEGSPPTCVRRDGGVSVKDADTGRVRLRSNAFHLPEEVAAHKVLDDDASDSEASAGGD
mmetsp:Transcript_45775/g.106297  ORF Transcript_45775/g.106297 Transcript_45775/m.106297 type:complete len:689 (-) Transcript_45775:65-2131(-)